MPPPTLYPTLALIGSTLFAVYLILTFEFQQRPIYLVRQGRTSLVPSSKSQPVHIWFDETRHFELDTAIGSDEFRSILPSGGHLVHLPVTKHETDSLGNVEAKSVHWQPFTVTLFHQLKCLDILRDDFASGVADPLREHCLNYIRQSLLCIADTTLEAITKSVIFVAYDHVCKDWRPLYDSAEEQHSHFLASGDVSSTNESSQ